MELSASRGEVDTTGKSGGTDRTRAYYIALKTIYKYNSFVQESGQIELRESKKIGVAKHAQ